MDGRRNANSTSPCVSRPWNARRATHKSCVDFAFFGPRIVAEEGDNRGHGLLGRSTDTAFPVAYAQPSIARCFSDLLLAPAEFEAAFLEVLADGLWAHLRSAFQRLKME